jgi:hypothetical protein
VAFPIPATPPPTLFISLVDDADFGRKDEGEMLSKISEAVLKLFVLHKDELSSVNSALGGSSST